ncbi:MAG TPA: DUF6600 domain-containing protein, partial [Dehalococcoidia bacterium]|nr:DUF6600 domain-containing protein [Dehalococcoidia bacterium]
EFAAALEPYGRWIRHPRYGEVWVPDDVSPEWRPYEYGHWVYTDDWGWYWVSDDNEDDWGWVVYHYGRWAFDRDIGWFWIPGDEWAPAWVDWRYGGEEIGWAPLPPENIDYDYEARPDYWVFVPMRYIGDERLRMHYIPRDRIVVVLRETRIVNRPVHVEGRRIWVNPGLAPGFIAARTHVTLHSYRVRPRVLSGTVNVQGAITVRREDLRERGAVRRIAPVTVQRTNVTIQPTSAPAPQPLQKNEPGRLGPHVPRAAQGTTAPPQQQQQQQQQQNGPVKPGAPGAPPPARPQVQPQQHAPQPQVKPSGPPPAQVRPAPPTNVAPARPAEPVHPQVQQQQHAPPPQVRPAAPPTNVAPARPPEPVHPQVQQQQQQHAPPPQVRPAAPPTNVAPARPAPPPPPPQQRAVQPPQQHAPPQAQPRRPGPPGNQEEKR